MCLLADMTLLLAWDAQEAGKIIETYKVFEHKPPDLIMEKQESNPLAKVLQIFHYLSFTIKITVKLYALVAKIVFKCFL